MFNQRPNYRLASVPVDCDVHWRIMEPTLYSGELALVHLGDGQVDRALCLLAMIVSVK